MSSTKEQWKRYAEALERVVDATLALDRAKKRASINSAFAGMIDGVEGERRERLAAADTIKAEIDTADLG